MAQSLEQHRKFHAHTDRTAPETCDFCTGQRPWVNTITPPVPANDASKEN